MLLESNLKSHLVCCLLSTNVHILLVMRSDFYDNQGNHNEGTHSESTRISSTFQVWYSPNYLPYARKFQIWSKTTFETPCIHWLRPWPKYVKKLGKMLLEKVSAFVCFRRVKCRSGCVAVWFWSVLLRTSTSNFSRLPEALRTAPFIFWRAVETLLFHWRPLKPRDTYNSFGKFYYR